MESNASQGSRSAADTLEERWQREHHQALARRSGSAAWVLGGCWVLFVVMDLLTIPPEMRGALVEVEIALGLFVVPALVWLSRRPSMRSMSLVMAALLTLVGLCIEAKMGAIARTGGMLRYDGLLLYVLGVYVLSGLSWRVVLAAGAVIGAGWVLLVSSCTLEREVMTSVYLVCANVIGLVNARLTEQVHRASFQRRVMVEEERQRVQLLAEALAAESLQDALTGMPNRRALAKHGEQLWSAARQSGQLVLVAMIDVDHFKAYNDRLGHPAGDEVLRQVGSAIMSVTGGSERQAFRYGGEEFTVLWAVDDASEVAVLSRRLHEAVAALEIPHPSSQVAALTVSVGLASCIAAQSSLASALAQADSLLYEAKRAGRARTQAGGELLALAG